jgi:cytochrome bd-type quinol oxidase subunit 1
LLTLASNLGAARSQMAFTLGFHIVLASLGVALPAMIEKRSGKIIMISAGNPND